MTILATIGRPANDEMIEGYFDGFDLETPPPSMNRSASYRHGWLNGRDDRHGTPRASASFLRQMAEEAMAEDDARKLS